MKNYLAITIGPIGTALGETQKTRELWAASFMFSQLMEYLVKGIKELTVVDKLLLPQAPPPGARLFGAGIYNDRLFAQLSTTDTEKIHAAVRAVIKTAIQETAADLTPAGTPDNPFWEQYFRVEYVIKPIADLKNGALFNELIPLLDSAELYAPCFFGEVNSNTPFTNLLTNVYDTPLAKQVKGDARGTYSGLMKGHFPSTSDIATYSLFKAKRNVYNRIAETAKWDEEEDNKALERFMEAIFTDEETKNSARDYHKYFCIVHADADNMGSQNATLDNDEAYIALSKKLAAFGVLSAGIIDSYGGKPVYIGGDDLLFFAPVCGVKNGQKTSVFQLIDELSRNFDSLNLGGPTLSFGLTITYYKYPLYEARDESYRQLMYRAKKAVWTSTGKKKNAVAFRFLKHSGAYFEGVFSKETLSVFVKAEVALRDISDDLISGIVYKMEILDNLLQQLKSSSALPERLKAMFDNFFNEPVHQRSGDQLVLIQELVLAEAASTCLVDSEPVDKNLYALLRLLNFVAGQSDDKRKQAASPAEIVNEIP